MASKRQILGMFWVLLFLSGDIESVTGNCERQEEELRQAQEAFEAYRSEVAIALKTIFDEQQPCMPTHDFKTKAEIKQIKTKLERMEVNFSAIPFGNGTDLKDVTMSLCNFLHPHRVVGLQGRICHHVFTCV